MRRRGGCCGDDDATAGQDLLSGPFPGFFEDAPDFGDVLNALRRILCETLLDQPPNLKRRWIRCFPSHNDVRTAEVALGAAGVRYSMDPIHLAHRSRVGRSARALSSLPNMPSPLSAVGPLWNHEWRPSVSGRGPTAPHLEEASFIDGSFAAAKKGCRGSKTKRAAREQRSWR